MRIDEQRPLEDWQDEQLLRLIDQFDAWRLCQRNWIPTPIEGEQIRKIRAEADRPNLSVPQWMRTATGYEDAVAELLLDERAQCVGCGGTLAREDLVRVRKVFSASTVCRSSTRSP